MSDSATAEVARPPARSRPAPMPTRVRPSLSSRISTAAFTCLVVAVLFAGWRYSEAGHVIAESGMGYAFGIVGASLMATMPFYSLRKRFRFMRSWGKIAYWFRIHMITGIVGPTLVLIHSNFKLGAVNSNVALITMLVVVASGLIGRFIYSRIHYGLYGRLATLLELRADAETVKQSFDRDLAADAQIRDQLHRFEQQALSPQQGALTSAWQVIVVGVYVWRNGRRLKQSVKRTMAAAAETHQWSFRDRRRRTRAAVRGVRDYLKTVQRVAQFRFFERLFAMWHVLHVPLFIILLLSVVAHIVAVHLY